jgi:2,5-diketo-D-gluconate reductase A
MTVTLAGGGDLPLVGFGTWRLRGESAYQAVRHALEVGYRHLDTATMYANEQEVGRALRDSGLDREDVFITTKLWQSDVGRERQTLEQSLRALDTDYVDLWLIHWPPGDQAGTATWREFLAARERGQARAVGVSNYSMAQLDELIGALRFGTGQGGFDLPTPNSRENNNGVIRDDTGYVSDQVCLGANVIGSRFHSTAPRNC